MFSMVPWPLLRKGLPHLSWVFYLQNPPLTYNILMCICIYMLAARHGSRVPHNRPGVSDSSRKSTRQGAIGMRADTCSFPAPDWMIEKRWITVCCG